jgi:phage terminase large subunit-like protein
MTITLPLPRLRRDQTMIAMSPAWTKVVCAGRRWGKTVMAGSLALSCAAHGGAVAWVAPTYLNSRPLWRLAERITAPIADRLSIRRADRMIDIPRAGSLAIYSADSPDSIRGEAFDLVIVDEAAMVDERVWYDVLMPTLADRRGRALLISTPRGRNWFWREYERANQNGAAWRAPSADNPLPSIREAAERARELVSDRTYRQEWLAEFVDEAGGVFRGVRACVRVVDPRGPFALGVDIGRDEDYTAVAVFDIGQSAILRVERWRRVEYTLTVNRIAAIARECDAHEVVVEQNAAGAPVVDYLTARGLPVVGVTTSATTKRRIIDRLAWAIERGEIALPQDDYALTELEQYAQRRRSDGTYEYSAPPGLHDDCVMAIAWVYSRAAGTSGAIAEAIW